MMMVSVFPPILIFRRWNMYSRPEKCFLSWIFSNILQYRGYFYPDQCTQLHPSNVFRRKRSDLVLQIHDASKWLPSHSQLSDCWLQPCIEDKTEWRFSAARIQESQQPGTAWEGGWVLGFSPPWVRPWQQGWAGGVSLCRNSYIPAHLQVAL